MECLQPTYTRAGIPVVATVHTYRRAYFILYTVYFIRRGDRAYLQERGQSEVLSYREGCEGRLAW